MCDTTIENETEKDPIRHHCDADDDENVYVDDEADDFVDDDADGKNDQSPPKFLTQK